MKVKINNFKCHQQLNLSFSSGVTLISGIPGAGKSTIFQSVHWALYGTLRNIDSNIHSGILSVSLETENLVIERRKKPNSLTVKLDTKEYYDEEAQTLINREFGSREVWELSSYQKQKEFNILLGGSNKENYVFYNLFPSMKKILEFTLRRLISKSRRPKIRKFL